MIGIKAIMILRSRSAGPSRSSGVSQKQRILREPLREQVSRQEQSLCMMKEELRLARPEAMGKPGALEERLQGLERESR